MYLNVINCKSSWEERSNDGVLCDTIQSGVEVHWEKWIWPGDLRVRRGLRQSRACRRSWMWIWPEHFRLKQERWRPMWPDHFRLKKDRFRLERERWRPMWPDHFRLKKGRCDRPRVWWCLLRSWKGWWCWRRMWLYRIADWTWGKSEVLCQGKSWDREEASSPDSGKGWNRGKVESWNSSKAQGWEDSSSRSTGKSQS